MNAYVRRLAPLLSAVLFQGCLSIVIDQTYVRGDVAMPAPAVVPDSAPSGSIHGSLFLDVSDTVTRPSKKLPEQTWTRPWASAGGQVQWVVGPHLRLLGGAQASSIGASWWGGPVVSVRDRLMRWDMELLAGTSRLEYEVRGRVTGSDWDDEPQRNDLIGSRGSGRRLWSQAALRARSHRSGPWVEGRLVPSVWITNLKDTATVGAQAQDEVVMQSVSAIAGGWIQEFRDGSMVVAGIRSTRMDRATSLSFLVSLQKPIF
jgi:hypothetical protein